jgi:protein-tyrosine kinase
VSLVEKALQKAQAQLEKRRESMEASSPVVARREEPASNWGAPATRPAVTPFVPSGPPVHIDPKVIREAGLAPVASQEGGLNRQLRGIKYNLLRKTLAASPSSALTSRTIMITSALPGDGKSSIAINLAMSIALEKDLKVVLVDADVPKPHLTSVLGLIGQRGLIDVISDPGSDPASVVRATSIRGLYFVPAGSRSKVATELLSSARMFEIARSLAALEPNMLVVFDSSPLLLTSESYALASLVSQIVMVVRSGVSAQSAVKDALAMLAEHSGSVSLVLNDARETLLKEYKYGYGFNFGDKSEPKDSA